MLQQAVLRRNCARRVQQVFSYTARGSCCSFSRCDLAGKVLEKAQQKPEKRSKQTKSRETTGLKARQ